MSPIPSCRASKSSLSQFSASELITRAASLTCPLKIALERCELSNRYTQNIIHNQWLLKAMNNDSASVSGPLATPPNGRSGSSSRRRRHDARTPAQRRAYDQMRKKYELASSLMTNIDFAIYCQLCVLYYMEYEAHPRFWGRLMLIFLKLLFLPAMYACPHSICYSHTKAEKR